MNSKLLPQEQQYILYKTTEGSVSVKIVFQDENLWPTQKHMAELGRSMSMKNLIN